MKPVTSRSAEQGPQKPQVSPSRSALHEVIHMEQQHSQEPSTKKYQCGQCTYGTDYASNLKHHERTHTGERPFACDVCGKEFTQLAHLQVHLRTHTGERPFVCTACGRAFAELGSLRKHERTHTGEKPFACAVCGKAFRESGSLHKHQRTHTGEKPFVCVACGKSFAQSSGRNRHQKLTCEGRRATMTPTLVKQEPEEECPSFATWPGVTAVKYEEEVVKVKCECPDWTPGSDLQVDGVSGQELWHRVTVQHEREDSTAGPDLQVDRHDVKQDEENMVSEEDGSGKSQQQFVDVEVWFDFAGHAE